MKKVLISVMSVAALAACSSYDYYKGDVKYTQDGFDCVYSAAQHGRHFTNDIERLDDKNSIVYRNTRCSDLMKQDMFVEKNKPVEPKSEPKIEQIPQPRPEHAIIVVPVIKEVGPKCGCKKCSDNQLVLKRRYIIVSGQDM